MDATVITSDVVSSVFASRELGLLLGDAREVLRTLAEDSVDCTVTSPPYYSGRRHVGDSVHEIGSEKTVEAYVEALASVGKELYRVTRPTGSYWLNLDDKCERKEWLGIPWRVAFAMREIGWKIRSEVIWHKPEHVPNAAKDRLTAAHEQLFHFVKRKDAYYDMDAIRKTSSPTMSGKKGVVNTPTARTLTVAVLRALPSEDRVCPENGKGSKIGLPSSCWGGACSATPQDPYRLRPIRRGMKAARLFSYDKPLKLVDVETPRLKNPADVIVRVTEAGVSHTA